MSATMVNGAASGAASGRASTPTDDGLVNVTAAGGDDDPMATVPRSNVPGVTVQRRLALRRPDVAVPARRRWRTA